jgi:hypothetical protein
MSTTEYLTDIKFRNAVKRATALRVFNKSELGHRFGVSIERARVVGDDSQTYFTVNYYGGNKFNMNSMEQLMKNNIRLVQDLAMAGFEIVQVSGMRQYSSEVETLRVYRKASA